MASCSPVMIREPRTENYNVKQANNIIASQQKARKKQIKAMAKLRKKEQQEVKAMSKANKK